MIGRRTLRKWQQQAWDWKTNQARTWRRFGQRLFAPVTSDHVASALEHLLPGKFDELLLHASMSRCGYIQGGAKTIIDAVGQHCGTLSMPTHTYCYPRKDEQIGSLYDAGKTLSVVGHVSNIFWQQDAAARSIHATHSIAAVGPSAHHLVMGHEDAETPCGTDTPYDKLIQRKAAVLMFGATMNSYTLFHTSLQKLAEADPNSFHWLYFPEPVRLQYVATCGNVLETSMKRVDWTIKRRYADMRRTLQAEGLLQSQVFGSSELLLIEDSQAVEDFVTRKLQHDPYYLVDPEQRLKLPNPRPAKRSHPQTANHSA